MNLSCCFDYQMQSLFAPWLGLLACRDVAASLDDGDTCALNNFVQPTLVCDLTPSLRWVVIDIEFFREMTQNRCRRR